MIVSDYYTIIIQINWRVTFVTLNHNCYSFLTKI